MSVEQTAKMPTVPRLARLKAFLDGDLVYGFLRTPSAVISAIVLLVIALTAIAAPLLSPQDPYDLTQLYLDKAELPPIWTAEGQAPYLLGTDVQGRDIFSAILYGSRISLMIGFASVIVSVMIGIVVGLTSGYVGGRIDNLLMRIGDLVLSIPTLLVAILVSAIFRELLPVSMRDAFTPVILTTSIAITSWVQYARIVRASTMVEARKEYVLAARILRLPPLRIMLTHILPNVMTAVLVTATLNLGLAILAEATLSFLGVGMPVTQPSLGTLIRIGNQYFFSGSWWVVLFPALQLSLIILAVNLLGDWLRDALNPKLR
ncbi:MULTISPECIES: ABC transporter permease [unclassified Mesorhizobium]|uniref:ABC transporter permease n=1 Tax=unclassified Mesorhizobium TaxID=325217 RepID=UPI0030149586